MDLISTVYAPRDNECGKTSQTPVPERWFHESVNKCDISNRNILVFTSLSPLLPRACAAKILHSNENEDSNPLQFKKESSAGGFAFSGQEHENKQLQFSGQYFVYVCDLNSPWDVQLVTICAHQVTTLHWDRDTGSAFVLADSIGQVEVWQMKESLISEWQCIHKSMYKSEHFIKATFVNAARRTYINMDNMETGLYHDKFVFRPSPQMAQEFGKRDLYGLILVSHTGLVVCLAVPKQNKHPSPHNTSSTVKSAQKSLDVTRGRVRIVDLAFVKDGSLLIAASNGDPKVPIRFYSVKTSVEECSFDDGIQLELNLETFPGLCVKAMNSETENGIDKCLGIVDLCFVTADDTDSVLVATKHHSGGRLELWELKEFQQNIHKMFLTSDSSCSSSTFSLPAWHYIEKFSVSGLTSQIVSVATPLRCFQTGRAAACYVTIAYSDGSIQCLIRDNLSQISSVDLPKSGNLNDDDNNFQGSSTKKTKTSVNICQMAFSATGNALVTIDSLGQLYIYRMSPITDPGGPHVPAELQTMFEYCLVSGLDWWDLTVCMKSSQIETICHRLEEDFNKQSKVVQDYYFSRYMSLKSSLFRLYSGCEYKAADCYATLMLHSIHGSIKSLLGPSELFVSSTPAMEKVSAMLQNSKSTEANIDALVEFFKSCNAEFAVDPTLLQSYRHLLQWVSNLTLHILASVPEYKHRQGPGSDLVLDKSNLNVLRELLFIIRVWGTTNEGILPTYTRTAESFDVLAKLFSLLTRLKDACPPQAANEAIIDECILLPSQVMIPPLDIVIPSKGLSHILLASANRGQQTPSCAVFNQEPTGGSLESSEREERSMMEKLTQHTLIEGAMNPRQYMDNVRHIFLGKKPYIVRECSRCAATSLPVMTGSSAQKTLNKLWDQRWLLNCPCGGPWKLACLEENSSRRRQRNV